MSSVRHSEFEHGPSRDLVQGVLSAFLRERRPQRILMVTSSPDMPPVFPGGPGAQLVQINTRDRGVGRASVRCAPETLPFQSRVFDLVLAHHVLCDGHEPEVAEFERVLEGGGHLLVLGLGYWGGRYRLSRGAPVAAAIRPLRLCRALRERDFVIESCGGQGIGGLGLDTGSGWRAPLVGVSDQVLILARSAGNQHVVSHLRFGRTQAVGARSAALDSLSREAAP